MKIFSTILFLLLLTTASCLFDKQVFQEDSSLTSLVHWHPWPVSALTGVEILAGQKITGEFKAPENRLGTISMRIYDFGRDNKDQIVFRLKEKNTSGWLYQKTYETSGMRGSYFWPFGFPPLENSGGKTYRFEIESLQGTPDDAIALLPQEKIFISKYSYPKSWLKDHKEEILPFFLKKIFLPFTRMDTVSWKYIFILPLLPLLIYLLSLHRISHFLLSFKSTERKNIFSLTIKKNYHILRTSKNEQEIFFKIAIVLMLMIVPFFLFSFFIPVPNTEQFEWLIYEIYPIVALIVFWGLGLFLNKKGVSPSLNQNIKILLITTLGFFLSILYLKNLFPKQIAFFLPIACLPILPLIRKTFKKTHSLLKTLGVILNNQYFWVNFIGIFGVFSFFYETLLNNQNNRSIFLEYLLIISLLGYLILFYQVSFKWFLNSIPLIKILRGKLGFFLSIITKIILVTGGSFLLFIAIYREVSSYGFYYHNIYHVGPAMDTLNGKSLLYDTPSLYGYLSIHFIGATQKIYGTAIGQFDLFNSILYVVFTVIVGLIFYKLTKKTFWAVILALVYISFQTFFSDYSSFLYPSSGPLRFGFGILMVFFLLYFPDWFSFILGTILASISVFWAAETAIYVVPAWLLTCLAVAWTKHGWNRAFLKESLLKISPFILTTLLLTLIILIKEYRLGFGFPPLWNLLDYSMAAKDGLYAVFMPAYGDYYLVILIMVFGLGILFHLLSKKLYPKVLPAIAFISIHNIAIFSYYVSRSWYSLAISIFGFYVIELALIYKAFQETKGVNQQKFKAYFALPLVIFSVLFLAKCYINLPEEKMMFKYNLSQLSVRKVKPEPLLTQIARDYRVQAQKVVILSEYDTLYLSETGAENLLPLNPASMTFSHPRWREKYIKPQIDKIPPQTVFVWDETLVDQDPKVRPSLKEIRRLIEEKYELTFLGEIPDKNIKIYQILGKKSLPEN